MTVPTLYRANRRKRASATILVRKATQTYVLFPPVLARMPVVDAGALTRVLWSVMAVWVALRTTDPLHGLHQGQVLQASAVARVWLILQTTQAHACFAFLPVAPSVGTRLDGACIKCPNQPWVLALGIIGAAVLVSLTAYILNRKNVNIGMLAILVDYAQVGRGEIGLCVRPTRAHL